MRSAGGSRGIRLLVGAWALALAGCAGAPPPKPSADVTVRPVERAAWNREPEPGLYRITWEAMRSQEIRARAAGRMAPEGLDGIALERWQLDEEADRELKARGLCTQGTARLHTLVDGAATGSAISGIFQCRQPVF